jgi:hypothetical protein
MWMWRWAQITPRSMVGAAVWAFEGHAGRACKVAGLADRRLDAELELLGHRDLDLGFLARRTEHADVGDAPLGADQMDLLGAGELAGLRQAHVPASTGGRGRTALRRRLATGGRGGPRFRPESAISSALAASSSWLRSMARSVSQATRRSSSLATTRMVTGESSVEMTAWSRIAG